jgi:Mrp family chromosome partitioning ATPase
MPAVDQPTAENPTAETPTAETPTAENPAAEKPTVEKPMIEELPAEEPIAEIEEPAIEEPCIAGVEESKNEEPRCEEPGSATIDRVENEEPSGAESPLSPTIANEYRSAAAAVAEAATDATADTTTDVITEAPAERPTEATTEAEVSEAVATGQKLKPAWEVDRLLWPADADHLYESENEYFRHAGEKLRDASQEGLRVLGVSSSHAGEGCTTLAICLARAAAGAGAKVALLDANLQSPQLGTALGLDFAHSWHEVLNGKTPLAEAAVTAIGDNVTLIPLSKHALGQGLSLDSDAVNDVLRQVSETFDLVLIDVGSPSEEARDRFQSGDACPLDAAIIVRDVRTTSEEETLESVSRFRAMGIEAVGIAENFAATAVAQAAA